VARPGDRRRWWREWREREEKKERKKGEEEERGQAHRYALKGASVALLSTVAQLGLPRLHCRAPP
jgi:hypothetical protein